MDIAAYDGYGYMYGYSGLCHIDDTYLYTFGFWRQKPAVLVLLFLLTTSIIKRKITSK